MSIIGQQGLFCKLTVSQLSNELFSKTVTATRAKRKDDTEASYIGDLNLGPEVSHGTLIITHW